MVKRIVLTGGPSSGKTSVLEKIDQVYSSLGYKVIIVDETATYLINKGIRPFGEGKIDMVDFQELVLKFQIAKEEVIDRAVEMMGSKNVIIVYDRGTVDNRAYINEEEFAEVLTRLNNVSNIKELMDKYDLVINLVGRKDFYTTENNEARSEDADQALKLGDVTLKGWLGHKNIRVVLPKEDFNDKIHEVLNIVNEILSEKEVVYQEKYLVDLKNSDLKKVTDKSTAMKMVQTYLMASNGEERRLRKVIMKDGVNYYYSVFRLNDEGQKILVSERAIDKSVYASLLEFRDPEKVDILKTRYYFVDQGEYFHLDVFDGNDEIGILEVNVSRERNKVMPEFLQVIDVVSNDVNYANRNLAKKLEAMSKVMKYD